MLVHRKGKPGEQSTLCSLYSLSRPLGGAVFLLTDGVVDIDKNPQTNAIEKKRIVTGILPKLIEAKAVARSEMADQASIDDLADNMRIQDGIR